ncbi:MAG: 16S rRNA (adenine(1518)-N(6)/adenine(1519)-N(6))-dimethyltransferase RsmA [Peptoniphilaceae bacterium]|nr:16S rRNA (adenine(1518)-N(6)/adenine(1519)-N(6))-dimethyltransferase RsmA [Peptoniphilaceae bacterium]
MKRLYTPSRIREVMAEHHLHFTKSLGQNFLIDGHAVSRIAEVAALHPDDVVLEVGPGIGTLTEELLFRAGYVIAIELDHTFAQVLTELFEDRPHFTLVEGDALKVDLAALLEEIAPGRPVKVVANVPYYITTPLLRRFLSDDLPVSSITILVQREVAERMAATVGDAAYGALSMFVALHGTAELSFVIPAASFMPSPKVDSAVVHIEREPARFGLDAESRERVNAVIRRAFQQRRKLVAKAIAQATGTPVATVREALLAQGLSDTARAENLSVLELIEVLKKLGYIKVEES